MSETSQTFWKVSMHRVVPELVELVMRHKDGEWRGCCNEASLRCETDPYPKLKLAAWRKTKREAIATFVENELAYINRQSEKVHTSISLAVALLADPKTDA